MARAKAVRIVLTEEERAALERNVRRRKSAHAVAQRSRMILLAADGLPNEEVAKRVGVSAVTIGIWRRRFATARLEGLLDRCRAGRPREIGDDVVEAVIALTLQSKPDGAARWSTRSMARRMGMSQSAISRIWRASGLEVRHHGRRRRGRARGRSSK